jgi:hypothetical protein
VPQFAGSGTPTAEAAEANPGRVRHQFSSTTFLRNDDKDVAAASPERQAESDPDDLHRMSQFASAVVALEGPCVPVSHNLSPPYGGSPDVCNGRLPVAPLGIPERRD